MGNQKKTFFAVILILGVLLVVPHSQNLVPPVRGGAPPNSPYTGSGGSIDVFEFARNDSSIFINGVNDSSFQYDASWFPSNYRGYQFITSVTNLARTDDPIPNGNFDKYNEFFHIDGSELNLERHNWTLTRNDGRNNNDYYRIISSIDNSSGGNPGDCMDITLRYGRTGLTTAIAYLESEFNYTSVISPSNLVFSFDIKFSNDITQESWLYVNVSLEYQAKVIASWQQTTDVYHPTSWDSQSMNTTPINGTVTLRVTVMKQGGSRWSSVYGHIYFDNFRYSIETPSTPSEVALTLNGEVVVDSGGQTGTVTIYADSANREEAPLSNCWTTNQNYQFASSFNISFHYSYSMSIKHLQSASATTSFSAPIDENPTWEVNYTIPVDQPPSGHVGYSFGLYLQPLWSFTEVKNETGDTLSTYSYNASSRFIKLDDGIASSGQVYSIYASSPNYVLQVYLQKSPTGLGGWTNLSATDYFVADDWLRVKALLRPIGPSGNNANVSIFYPNQTIWQSETSVSFHDNNNTLTSTAWQVPNIQETDAGSEWIATVAFNNATQCGLKQQSFAVVIPSRGNEISPDDQERVILGQMILVNVTWQNDVTSQYITDASARVRYIDRNLQVQYEPMVPNGLGAYSVNFDTGSMSPNDNAEFYVELIRYGYVNATYDYGTHLTFNINLVNDLEYAMIKPTQESGPNEYTAQTTRDTGYTTQVRFYDSYLGTYVRNDSGIWMNNVRVNFTYYEDPTGPTGWTLIGPGSFVPDSFDATIFLRTDTSYGDVEAVKYEVTMWIDGLYSWEYEQQNFTIIIEIVSLATNLDAVRTQITYPPAGSGDGWTQYENDTDVYTAYLYWNEFFNITVFYENESTSTGIPSATVQLLIGTSLYSLNDISGGYYYYILNTTTLNLGQTDLYVNASLTAHAEQTIKIRVFVESRITQLTKDYPYSSVEIPYDDDFIVRFNFTDIVSTSPSFITDATVLVVGYESDKYTVSNYLNGTYSILFWGNISESIYEVSVYFSLTNYTTQNQYFELTIRYIETHASGSALSGSVPWGDNVTIILSYNDTDHDYNGIDGASITFTWLDNIENVDYWIIPLGDGTYSIILNTAKVATGTQGFTLNFVLNKIHYDGAQVSVSFQVRDILTVLYITSISPGSSIPWGDILTITLTFNDTDHSQISIPYATITCDWDEFYWSFAYNPANGAYTLTIRTESRLEGSYTIHIYASKSHYQTFMTLQNFLTRNIQTNYQANPIFVPAQPWGDNVTIQIDYLDLDHGSYIPFAEIDTDWNESFYTIYLFGNGTYIIEFNTTCCEIGTHTILITLSRTHYMPQNVEIDLTLRGRNTVVSNDTPQPVPFTNDLTFTVFYNDSDTTDPIHNITGNVYIILGCSSHPTLTLNYTIQMLNYGYDGYFITIRTDNFLEVNVWYTFLVNISWSNILPYYQNHSLPVSGFVRSLHTSLELDFESIVFWGDNLYLNATYRDVDHDIVLSNGTVTLWLSWPFWSLVQIYPDGTYLIQIDSSAENIGLANFTIRFSKPFYETCEQRVQFTVNPLPLYVEVLSASPWVAEYQTSVNISVRVTDEYGRLMNDTKTTYYWAGLFPVNLTFVGNGIYNITFLANQSVGTYLVTIEASNLPNYQSSIGIVMLTIIPIDSVLTVSGPPGSVVAGDTFQIEANFSTVYGSALPNATVYYNWAGGNGTLTHISGRTFEVILDSSGLDAGHYTIYITASHQNVIEQLRTISVSLIVMPAYLESDIPVINVDWGYNFTVRVQFYDHNLLPITGANIQYIWGTLNGTLQPEGIPGWYNISLPSDIFSVGIYELTLTCDHEGYQFALTTIGLNIQPRQTNLDIVEIQAELHEEGIIIPLNGTAWQVPRGDILWIYLNFTDRDGIAILNSTSVYTWEFGSGVLQFSNGLYVGRINLTDVTPGIYSISITLSRHNFETASAPLFQLTVIPVPTEIIGLDDTLSIVTGESFTLHVIFYDTYHDIVITDASLLVSIPALGINQRGMLNNGDGSYTLGGLTALREGIYSVTIDAIAAPKYAPAMVSMTLVVSLSPIFRTAIQVGAIIGVILIISLLIWLAYAKVYSIPWIVRRMRKMTKTIDRGKVPSLSKGDTTRILDRDNQLLSIITPSYSTMDLSAQPVVIPTSILPSERRSEDEDILTELEQLEGLGSKEKEELFKQMKKIPAKDRVWFMDDMKRQMAEGRFDYLRTGDAEVEVEVEEETTPKPGLSPSEQATLVAVLREGLAQFTMISDEDKEALVQQLIIMTPEEREATIKKLIARMKGLQLEESETAPKIKKRRKKTDFETSDTD